MIAHLEIIAPPSAHLSAYSELINSQSIHTLN